MVRRWCPHRRQAVAFFLAAFSLLSLLFPPRDQRIVNDGHSRHRIGSSVCRPDMEVTRLPPMPDDDDVLLHALFRYLTEPSRAACDRVLRFGGMSHLDNLKSLRLDGHKYMCADAEFTLLSSTSCLVYSFGISEDWSFDFDMESFGCTVHAFDPTTNDTAGYQNGSIFFHKHGIGGWDGQVDGMAVRSLDSIAQRLGHAARTVHYLKLDVEGSEWAVFEQQVRNAEQSTLFRNVEQLGAELHFTWHLPVTFHREFYRRVYRALLGLQAMGFYPFAHEWNWSSQLMDVPGFEHKLPSAMEVAWVKSRCAPEPARWRTK
ncbi:uncharacterized protein LOC122390692 isoform X1 [Amphibalanus amphitrite]|uniref:uncharacterized protein LOC122390692 isoform X1 n=2 Tax=Amphibalanus amphitrite TaxID=1232801 RepID=UPI001C922593|nr:uncharacterized protein LOC122390692 isoform X1 [Amphibalanus amphitrite]